MGSCGGKPDGTPVLSPGDGDAAASFARGRVQAVSPGALTQNTEYRKFSEVEPNLSFAHAEFAIPGVTPGHPRLTPAGSDDGDLSKNASFATCLGDEDFDFRDEDAQLIVPRKYASGSGGSPPWSPDGARPGERTVSKVILAADSKRKLRRLPDGVGLSIPPGKSTPKVMGCWDFTTEADVVQHLRTGGSCYAFLCTRGSALVEMETEKRMIASIIDLTCFEDEERDNCIPSVDVYNAEDVSSLIFVLNKGCYVLPHPIQPQDLTVELFTSYEYQRGCQGPGTKVWKHGDATSQGPWHRDVNTFRITIPIIPMVLKLTVQFRVSEIPQHLLPGLSHLVDGLEVHAGLLMERTKVRKNQADSTKKVKSVFLMHRLPGGGVLCANITAVAQGSIPGVFARVADKFGSMGANDVADTGMRTRQFMLNSPAVRARRQ